MTAAVGLKASARARKNVSPLSVTITRMPSTEGRRAT
ncbi:hypothetical protein ACVIYL_003128 [Bradyrhizobium sp. USDA 3315]